MFTFVCYDRCGTCKKAEKWLQEHQLDYTNRPIKEENPTAEELKQWHQASGLPIKRFFNTSGQLYREMGIKDRIPSMTDEEIYALLATDGMLVKRPILLAGDQVLVGFKEKEWEGLL
jgi:arsenate reductase